LRANEALREKVVGLVNSNFDLEEGWGKGRRWTENELVQPCEFGGDVRADTGYAQGSRRY
jgi:3'(2'), 5'-bisphosphate nucleotidase